jgi:hypothetical protein
MGSQKFPGILVLHIHTGTLRNLLHSRILAREGTNTYARTHAHTPWVLTLSEALAEGFCWNLPEFGRRVPFDAPPPPSCKTTPLEAHFKSREQPKVTGSEIR